MKLLIFNYRSAPTTLGESPSIESQLQAVSSAKVNLFPSRDVKLYHFKGV